MPEGTRTRDELQARLDLANLAGGLFGLIALPRVGWRRWNEEMMAAWRALPPGDPKQDTLFRDGCGERGIPAHPDQVAGVSRHRERPGRRFAIGRRRRDQHVPPGRIAMAVVPGEQAGAKVLHSSGRVFAIASVPGRYGVCVVTDAAACRATGRR